MPTLPPPSLALKLASAMLLFPFAIAFSGALLGGFLFELNRYYWAVEMISLIGTDLYELMMMFQEFFLLAALPVIIIFVSAAFYLLPWIVSIINRHPARVGICI